VALSLTRPLVVFWAAGLMFLPALGATTSTNTSPWLTSHWLKEDGLPDNRVYGLVQTPDGYIWIATPTTGLSRFDGFRFTEFPSSNFVAAPNRGILAMTGDGHGGLRLAMERGAIVSLNGRQIQAFLANRDVPDLAPFNIVEDGEKSLWISYRTGQICRIKDGKVTVFSEADGLPATNSICSLACDRNGQIWFAKGTEAGVFRSGRFRTLLRVEPPARVAAARDGGVWICYGSHLFKFTEGGKPEDLGMFTPRFSSSEPPVLLEDHGGAVWIGTTFSGLFRFNGSSFEKIPTTYSIILNLIEDTQGNIWVGTDGGGLNRVRPRAVELQTADTGLPFEVVQSITEDTNLVVWAVTQNGALVRQIGGQWVPLPAESGLHENASVVCATPSGDVWIGTRTRELFCWRTNGLFKPPGFEHIRGQTVMTLLAAKSGDLYLSETTPNGVERYRNGHLEPLDTPPDTSPLDIRSIRAVAEDAAGNVWFGSSKGLLMRVEGDRLTDETKLIGGTPLSIRCLYATTDGALWIGFSGFGAGRLKDGHFKLFSAKEGLHDEYISQILADDKGWLWFGSGSGIFKVRQGDLEEVAEGRALRVQSVHYGATEGLAGLQANMGVAPMALRASDGRLWMPTRTALAFIDPDRLGENLQSPPILLTRVSAGDRTLAWYGGALPVTNVMGPGTIDLSDPGAALKLPPDHRRLEFEFTAPSFIGSENIRFRYRLHNVDEGWVESTTRSNSYPRLDDGSYSFEVAACNNEGIWSQSTAALKISVSPFFWKTWWFRSLAIALFTGCIVAVVRYVSFRRLRLKLLHLEQQAALHQERARIAKDIHDDLGANLTQIALLGDLASQDRTQPDKAGEHVAKISVTARQLIKSLDEIVWAVNPSNDTLAHLIDYTGQFALDFLRVAGIRCRLDFPEQAPAREVSTDVRHDLFLIVKEALNNIVKHSRATEVWLRIQATDSLLRIAVEDNGCGFDHPPDRPGADGLLNMRARAAEIGGNCRIESRGGDGTKVIVELDWNHRSNSKPHLIDEPTPLGK
jgi:signal transduction histidine kinase/ligand-binding sensor domain-containing protein